MSIKSIKGMNDLLPEKIHSWQALEAIFHELFKMYDYREIRTPLVESTALFSRSIGELSDIVSKEMYTFEACFIINNAVFGIKGQCFVMNARRKEGLGSFIKLV